MKLDEMISHRGPVMMSYLRQKFYKDSSRMLELLDTLGLELDGVWYTFADIRDQCFIDRATWGLEIWEKEFGLQAEPSDTYEIRRTRIKAKIIGFGSFTEAVSRELVNAYSRSGTALFIPIYEQYSFKTQYSEDDLISYAGIKDAFEEAKPAHLRHLIGLLLEIAFPFDVAAWAKVKGRALLGIDADPVTRVRLRAVASVLGFGVHDAVLSVLLFDGTWRFDGSRQFNGLDQRDLDWYLRESIPFRSRTVSREKIAFPVEMDGAWLARASIPISPELSAKSTWKASPGILGVGEHDNIDLQALLFNGWYFDGLHQFNGVNSKGLDLYYEMAIPCTIRHFRNGQIIEG